MTDSEILELVLKNQNDIQESMAQVNGHLDTLEAKVDKVNSRLDNLEAKVDKVDASQIRMENELTEKVRALFDAREVENDVNERIITTLGRIETKIDVLQMETASIRRVK